MITWSAMLMLILGFKLDVSPTWKKIVQCFDENENFEVQIINSLRVFSLQKQKPNLQMKFFFSPMKKTRRDLYYDDRLLFLVGLKVKCFLPWTPESEILRDRTHSRRSTRTTQLGGSRGRGASGFERDRPPRMTLLPFCTSSSSCHTRGLCYGQRYTFPLI